MKRLGILISHPIQYYAPWFRYLGQRFNIEVFYAHRQDPRGQAEAGFGIEFDWDTPLLDGYPYRWLANVARHPNVNSFSGCDTPGIYDIIKKERFDVFLVCGWQLKSYIQAIRACWRNNVPVFLRGDSQLLTRRSGIKLALKYLPYRWFLNKIDAHLYVGKRNRDYLRHYGVPENKLFFSPHFVDNDFFRDCAESAAAAKKSLEIRSRLGIPPEAFVFMFVGKMAPYKRPGDFIQACIKLFSLPQGADVHALLVGDGSLRERLEFLAKPYPGRIHFAGFQNQTQLPFLYRAGDALVLPSEARETWGLVVNEAFACGIPAIVTDEAGCSPDLIEEGLTGYTYPAADMDKLLTCMLALKNLYRTTPRVVKRSLMKKVACYSVEKTAEALKRAANMISEQNGGNKYGEK